MIFLITDILLFPITGPIAGVRWAMKQIQTMANEERMNDQVWKERLIELQMKLELGEISEADYAVEEKEIFQRLREIRQYREDLARQYEAERGDEDDGISIHTGYGEDR